MDDKELLTLAAKAAGMRYDLEISTKEWLVCYDDVGESLYWQPQHSDGDALRLAVKLKLQVTPGTYNNEEFTAYRHVMAKEYGTDPYAATRRAIVRAAAEIGKGMK